MERLAIPGEAVAGTPRRITWDKMVEFERVVWDRGPTAHNSRETAKLGGMGKAFASGQNTLAFIHEMLERDFGKGWIEGGKISVRWTRLVYENDLITPFYQIEGKETVRGRQRATMKIWAENQDGEQTAVGTASAYLL
jgi:acyl dehydratase